MSDFRFTVAFMLPEKVRRTKNFCELLDYAHSMDFQTSLSSCLNDSQVLLRAGKAHCSPLEVANLFVALHLLVAQRKQDLIIVGTIDQTKYEHCLFATLSIEKIRHWSEHLMNRLAGRDVSEEEPLQAPSGPQEERPPATGQTESTQSDTSKPLTVVLSDNEARVLH